MRVLRPKAWWSLQEFRRELLRIGGDNLVAYWPLFDLSGVLAEDIGPNNEPLDIVGTTLGQKGLPQLGRSHYFDGINDVDGQHVYEDETGSSWGPTVHGLSLVNGNAFMRTQGVDLNPFAGVEGSDTPYMLVLTDDAGDKVAWGYIGAADAAEGLGADLFDVGAGVFTAGTYSWMTYGTNTIANDANTLKVTYVDNTAGALLYLRDTADLSSNLTIGKLYKLTFDTKVDVGDNVTVSLWSSGYNVLSRVVTETDFTNVTWYFTADSANNMYIRQGFMGAGEDIWFDNIVLTEVTHVGTDAVHIVSTRDGGTRNWAGIEATFDYNDSAYTFEVRKTLFQITGALTTGAWIKTAYMGDVITSKYVSTAPNARAWNMALGGVIGEVRFVISGNGSTNQLAAGTIDLSDNEWHLVIGVFVPSTAVYVYVDGVLDGSDVAGIPATIYDTFEELRVGVGRGTGTFTGWWHGNLSHAFIISAALDERAVKRLYDIGRRAHSG